MTDQSQGQSTYYAWQWQGTGPTPVNYGLDSEIFDSEKFPYGQTFVREAIQNSLDARSDKDAPVCVKFQFHSSKLEKQTQFLGDLQKMKAQCDLPWPEEWDKKYISWLVVEDSNTNGLKGALDERGSDFWNYWLNFGISNKDGRGRGGRGIGRVTFLIASKINTVIGLTRRQGPDPVVACGMSLMRPVLVGKELKVAWAYLAEKPLDNTFRLYGDPAFLGELSSTFVTTDYRKLSGCGFSLIIPYPHSNLTAKSIVAAAIEHFGPAIISRALVLEVDGRVVDRDTIDDLAFEYRDAFSDQALRNDPIRLLNLARATVSNPDFELTVNNTGKSLMDNLQSETIEAVRLHYANDSKVALAIDLPIQKAGKFSVSRIRAALSQGSKGQSPIDAFFREGMCLPDVVARNAADVDLVVQCDSGELVQYLNLCEGKAHLNLLENSEVKTKLTAAKFNANFDEKRFIKRLMDDLRLLVLPDQNQPDKSIFDRFFAVPRPALAGEKRKPNKKTVIVPPVASPKVKVFLVDTLPDGFRVKSNPAYESWPINLHLEIAYADGSTRPAWDKFDFQLSELKVKTTSSFSAGKKGNQMVFKDCDAEFELEILGFDKRRELITNVRPYRNA